MSQTEGGAAVAAPPVAAAAAVASASAAVATVVKAAVPAVPKRDRFSLADISLGASITGADPAMQARMKSLLQEVCLRAPAPEAPRPSGSLAMPAVRRLKPPRVSASFAG